GNGNLLIGHAYTRRLGLEPGQEFRIELRQDSRSIWLLPMNNKELKVAEVSPEQDQDTKKDQG
ncbi:MAG: transcriptional regulator, partial [Synechococcus sp. BS30m-G30]|nr:transcriptional regulator [Synechococcus sp. BS30m-G30]